MKYLMIFIAVLSLLSSYSIPATAQDEDCWDYEDGNVPIVGICDTPDVANGVAVLGDYAYVADNSSGLQVLDITDPANPRIVGSVVTPDNAGGVTVSGNYAYIVIYHGLQVVDISDPVNPQTVYSMDIGDLRDVAISGNYAYVSGGTWGLYREYGWLKAIDITNPARPQVMGSVNTRNLAFDVEVSGSYAYVTMGVSSGYGPGGLCVIDITDPRGLEVVGDSGDIENVWRGGGLAVAGGYAYYIGQQGLEVGGNFAIFDISDPTVPRITSNVVLADIPMGVEVSGSYAYLVTYYSQLYVFDITNPFYLHEVGNSIIPGHGRGMTFDEPFVYICSADIGLAIGWQQCSEVVFVNEIPRPGLNLAVHPNPFNPQTTIVFDLLQETSISLDIYNVAGRLVMDILNNEIYAAGTHSVLWRGRDERGRALPSGAYLVRLTTEHGSQARQVMLVR